MGRANMLILLKRKSLFLLALLLTGVVYAKDKQENAENLSAKENQKKEIKEYIMHHLQDSYDFQFIFLY